MQKSPPISLDRLLFVAAFGLALFIRLLRLSQAPLTDAEAGLALQALGLAKGNLEGMLAGQPGYLLPTTVLFAVFGAGNAAARWVPALAGAALALTPALFRKEIGRTAALAAAFGIALDPGLNALSRQASAFSWAVLFGLLGFAGLKRRNGLLTGLTLGLAVLAGGQFWQGLLGAGLGYGFWMLVSRRTARSSDATNHPSAWPPGYWKTAILSGLASLVLGGSLFFIDPRGISAAGSGLVEFVSGWVTGDGGRSVTQRVLALTVYETFGLVFSVIQVFRVILRREKKAVDLALAVWWLSTLLIGFLYPVHGEINLGWSLIPMWGLAARWLAETFSTKVGQLRWLAFIQAAVLFALAVFAWLNLLGLLDPAKTPDEISVRWIAALGALFMAGASLILVTWGWSRSAAANGGLWAGTALLSLWSISALFSASGLGANPEAQLWRSGPAPLDQDLLLGSIGDYSEWNTGFRNTLDLSVIQIDSPALKWILRDFTSAAYFDVPPLGSSPSLALTRDQSSPGLAATYRGQDFLWMSEPAWDLMSFQDWAKWAVFKNAPMNSDKIILWVRTDLFPGAAPEQGP